jgi:hypothetical protein
VGEAQLGRGAGHVGQGVVLPLHSLQHTARALARPQLTVVSLKTQKSHKYLNKCCGSGFIQGFDDKKFKKFTAKKFFYIS